MTVSRTQTYLQQQLTSVRLVQGSNLAGSYYNGPSNNGVGATLTKATAGALTIDSVAAEEGDRVALISQTSGYQNGIYIVVEPGDTGTPWQLKRSYDFQSIEQMKGGQFFSANAGTVLGGSMHVVIEPLPAAVGVDDITIINVSSGGSGLFLEAANNLSDVANAATSATNLGLGAASNAVFGSVTVGNTGLHILDTNATHDLIIAPGSNLTADRTLTVTTGDADRTLDISAGSVTVSAYGAGLTSSADATAARAAIKLKSALTATWAGGGTSHAFTATGLDPADFVVANIVTSTNSVAVTKAVPSGDTLTITFSADPGANTSLYWIAINPV
jgi:hypothetical protein